jgi:hypothetical protein
VPNEEDSSKSSRPDGGPKEHLSQFIVRLLDQVTLTAWLSAVAVVLLGFFLFSMRDALVEGGAEKPIAEVVSIAMRSGSDRATERPTLFAAAVVVAALIAEAAAYDILRALEGVAGPLWLLGSFGRLRCRRHCRKLARLKAAAERSRQEAWATAAAQLRQVGYFSSDEIDLLGSMVTGTMPFRPFTAGEIERLDAVDWRRYADTYALRRWDRYRDAIEMYPVSNGSITMTRLGNVLRASEDRCAIAFDPQSLPAIFDDIPLTLQSLHDKRRNLLEFHCLMVAICLVAGLGGTILFREFPRYALGASAIAFVGAWLSYYAAVSAARGYGTTLQIIANHLQGHP